MKKKTESKFVPLNQNLLVLRPKGSDAEEIVNGIIMPVGVSRDTTELVKIIAISPELILAGDVKPTAKVGDKVLIRKGLAGTPVYVDNVEHLLIGYSALIAIV
jgi:co-chaperonin GroES (HSP10)